MIEISHISIDEMTANNLTKTLLSNKFKEFIELIRVSKIEFSDSKPSNDEPNNSDKNDENLVTNYYKEADEEEISFETEKAE